jgi:hypothetical protein
MRCTVRVKRLLRLRGRAGARIGVGDDSRPSVSCTGSVDLFADDDTPTRAESPVRTASTWLAGERYAVAFCTPEPHLGMALVTRATLVLGHVPRRADSWLCLGAPAALVDGAAS